jgi:hypothetical protein
MNEKDILSKLNLSDADLQDLITKYHNFVSSLNPAQRAALEASLPSVDEVAKTIGGGVTSDQLTNFVAARLPATTPTASFLFFLAANKKK